ncbi:hypothetical protein CJ030_MR0G013394 [Morella rubra]|uniref:Uncharacterized protein n=1 Tax=Morella rubra TaxID=262757 RepID=A0A6A1UJ24_9ROSI|nr:hypothetical protein CJ030_MR0G013394 [Morella rubra]
MIPLTRNDVEAYVPVTDKSGPQQREVEGKMIPRNRSVKIVVILKNMTPRTKDDVMLVGGKRLRCDSLVRAESSPEEKCNQQENRAKLKIVHTSGARSFQRARALLKNPEFDEISPALLYKKTHTNRDGMWTSENAWENFEKMEALQLQHESEGKSYTEVEIFAEMLETEVGYVRASSIDLSRRLEEARLQIEEMRARHLEYEALLVKWSDMEQAMREHLQMNGGAATEERRRVDVDDGRAQRKKDEEHWKMKEE